MSLERIFKALLSLDLSHIDAKVYMFIALTGPKKKLSIVNDLKINKQQISKSLVNLKNRGVFLQTIGIKMNLLLYPLKKH